MPQLPDIGTELVEVSGRTLHVRHFGGERTGPPLVFLHEGLGSVDLWRDFPAEIVDRIGRPGVAYSRYGNGWSTPLAEARGPDYMHREAREDLPGILAGLGSEPPILIGHSDGASIAIIYAGSGHPVRGLVLIAPHVFVEPETVAAIESMRESFATSDMSERMGAYHRNPVATFHGWADIWLSPGFRDWNIEGDIRGIRCPTLMVQGDADEYGTERQLDAIDDGLSAPADRLLVSGAGHSPHLSHPGPVADAVVDFIDRLA